MDQAHGWSLGIEGEVFDQLRVIFLGLVGTVGAVISGLPLLSLPREMSTAIFAAISEVLQPGRRYVQFTYSKRMWKKFQPPGFRFDQTKMVWLNVPPAVVMPFTRIA